MNNKDRKKFTKLTRSGISLIVLIITIIIVIILASVVILTISKNNPLRSAKEATFKSDVRNFQDELSMYVGNQVLMDYGGTREKITTSENPKIDEMQNYILSFTKNYEEKLGIEDDELVYFPDKVTDDEKKWLEDLGINPYGYKIKEADTGFFEWDGSKIIGVKSSKEEEFKEFIVSNKCTLKIPAECTAIGDSVFNHCDFLEKVIVNDNVISIGRGTFFNCNNLKQVKLSNNINTIGGNCFSSCENLKTINLPENLTEISNGMFANCYALDNIVVPKNVIILRYNAFSSCYNLKNLKLQDGLKIIEQSCFQLCISLEQIEIPETVNYLGQLAFSGCSSLSSVKMSDNITSIQLYAFSSCKNLKEINLPKNLNSIYDGAFSRCSSLENINIHAGVTSIGAYAFDDCNNLTINCEIEETNIPTGWNQSWNPDNRPVNWGVTM